MLGEIGSFQTREKRLQVQLGDEYVKRGLHTDKSGSWGTVAPVLREVYPGNCKGLTARSFPIWSPVPLHCSSPYLQLFLRAVD